MNLIKIENMKKILISALVAASIIGAPVAQANPYSPGMDFRHPSEIAREEAKSPLQRFQDNITMRIMQASFLGFVIPDGLAAGNTPAGMEPLAQCVANSSGSAEIQPVQMVATWACLATNPSLNPMPAWYM